jgi:double-stranded uracil-DNA glycosylase
MITCFPPIASAKASVLILGSFPGKESLRKQQYYAHPRNSFWSIMEDLFQLQSGLSYVERIKALQFHGIALWDVLLYCWREGSLDSSIDDQTIIVNDFQFFFRKYKKIKWVYFNGTKAEKEYEKRVLISLDASCNELQYQRLPSTSPAMAMLTRDEKLAQWATILDKLAV